MTKLFNGIQSSRLYRLSIILILIFPILIPLIDWLSWNFHWSGRWRDEFVKLVEELTKRRLRMRLQEKAAGELNAAASVSAACATSNPAANTNPSHHQDQPQQPPFRGIMFDHVIDQYARGNITKEQYIANACFIMPASDKTSSDTLSHTLYLLAAHAHVQERLRESIMHEGSGSEYLNWVLKESLRLRPAVTSGCSRITKREIKTKEGYTLPAGTAILTPSFVIHRL